MCDVVRDNISLLPFETLPAWSYACLTPGFSAFLRTRTSALHAQCLSLVSGQSVILSELIKIIKCAKSATIIYAMHVFTNTVRDTKNLSVVPRRNLRIVVRNGADLLQGGHGSFVQADMNFARIWVENGGNQKANFVHSNNARIKKDIARIVRIIIVGLDIVFPRRARL